MKLFVNLISLIFLIIRSTQTKIVPVYDPKQTLLDYIEINAPGLSFRPFNQQFYPFAPHVGFTLLLCIEWTSI